MLNLESCRQVEAHEMLLHTSVLVGNGKERATIDFLPQVETGLVPEVKMLELVIKRRKDSELVLTSTGQHS